MDFAGQLDTNGHEIEIANTVGLYNTLSRVRSVRLVLVIDFKSMETLKGQVWVVELGVIGLGEGENQRDKVESFFTNSLLQMFMKCLEYVNGFVSNLNEKFRSIVVLFTHAAKLSKLKVRLVQLQESVTQGASTEFLEHLVRYVNDKGDALLIHPTNSVMRERVVEVIKDSMPMETNADSFRFFLPNETRMLLVC